MCISYDKYAAFYTNIKATLAVDKAVLEACKDIENVADADQDDGGKQAALARCNPVLRAAEATNRNSDNECEKKKNPDTECFL